MSWDREMDNYAMECERMEARDAAMHADPFTTCHRHDYVPDGRGGGTCRDCGDHLDRDEL